MKVMTFNLRVDVEVDGINRFFSRTDRVLEVIRNESPDLIGFQEAKDNMRAFLRENLKNDYTVLGCGYDKNYKNVGNPIAFKSDRFELLELQTKWFSPYPDEPGSKYETFDQSKYPRYYYLAKLRVIETDEIIYFVNAHTDHAGATVRVLASYQILKLWRDCKGYPMILVGDLNAKPDSKEIQLLSSDPDLKMVDVTSHISGSFHQWGKLTDWKIDYIFTNLPCVESYKVEDIPVNGVYISDHNPVVAVLQNDNE